MDKDTMLYRQIHPSWIIEEGVSSQAFEPTPKDNQKLSAYDGNQFTPQQSFEHYTNQQLKSDGVLSVTNEEFANEELACIPDDEAFKGHVLIDFSQFNKPQTKKKAKKLRDIALQRNWLYQKPSSNTNGQDHKEDEESIF